jgi:hypothetical protein
MDCLASDGNGRTSKTDNELKTKATYEGAVDSDGLGGLGWDFTNIWKIDEGSGYPILKWQMEQGGIQH